MITFGWDPSRAAPTHPCQRYHRRRHGNRRPSLSDKSQQNQVQQATRLPGTRRGVREHCEGLVVSGRASRMRFAHSLQFHAVYSELQTRA